MRAHHLETTGSAALDYVLRGWPVVPLRPGTKRPMGRLVRHGWHDATRDPAVVERWWRLEPEAGVAIACEPAGLIAFDVDPRHGGDDELHALERRLGELPATVEACTGGGGSHLLFRAPREREPRSRLGNGVEIKYRGVVVAAPTLHPSGRRYAWSVDGHPEEVPPAELPEGWLDACTAPTRLPAGRPNAEWSSDPVARVPADVYIELLSGRRADSRGYVRCPFHAGGLERTPSLKVDGPLWTCFGSCPPGPEGRQLGGDIYTFAALMWGCPLPVRGASFLAVSDRLGDLLLAHHQRRAA